MSREITVPQCTFTEEIQSLQEFVPVGDHTPGLVRVVVGRMINGSWAFPQQFQSYEIAGVDYDKLIGDGAGWAEPNKPVGTYRNEDLWYFVDQARGS